MKKLAMLASGLSLLLINGVVMAQDSFFDVSPDVTISIPEPSVLALLGIGAVGLIAMHLRKRK